MLRRATGLRIVASSLVALGLGACSAAPLFGDDVVDSGGAAEASVDAPGSDAATDVFVPPDIQTLDVPPPPETVYLYANTANALYSVDPRSFAVRPMTSRSRSRADA